MTRRWWNDLDVSLRVLRVVCVVQALASAALIAKVVWGWLR